MRGVEKVKHEVNKSEISLLLKLFYLLFGSKMRYYPCHNNHHT